MGRREFCGFVKIEWSQFNDSASAYCCMDHRTEPWSNSPFALDQQLEEEELARMMMMVFALKAVAVAHEPASLLRRLLWMCSPEDGVRP